MRLGRIYANIKKDIKDKKACFQETWENNNEIFKELLFCICTPQSKAQRCWEAVTNLPIKLTNQIKIADILGKNGVRFKINKSKYIIEAYNKFKKLSIREFISKIISDSNIINTRNWLAENIKGIGMKEASHFLRNIGYGNEICILDRHILRNLKEFKIINDYDNLNKKRYLEIENKMKQFAKKVNIPVFALDFVFWWRANETLFK